MRHLLRIILLFSCLSSLGGAVMGQFQLVVENAAKFKRERIEVGDLIAIRVRGMDELYEGTLQKVKADKIYIFGDSIPVDSLDRIHLARPHGTINMLRGALIMTAIIYPVMMVVNMRNDQWTWNKATRVATVAASALILQKVLKRAYWKRYRVDKGKWQLRIMPTVESLL